MVSVASARSCDKGRNGEKAELLCTNVALTQSGAFASAENHFEHCSMLRT